MNRWTSLTPWLPPVTWALAIFALSATPGASLPRLPGLHSDKLVHGVVYAILGALVCRALDRTRSLRPSVLAALAASLAALYGVTDEIHQLFVPGRMGDVADVAADAVGGLTGALARLWTHARAAPGPMAPRRGPRER